MTLNKLMFTFLAALTVGATQSALALEDEATLPGKFTWIIPDSISNQYPDVNLGIARDHYVSELKVTRNAAGKFVIRVTLPTTLTAGQTVRSTYVEQSRDENDIRFVNPARADDYLRCNIRDTWAEVRCSDVTLKGVTAVPQDERESFAQSLYEGTPSETGMIVVAGAEPGGEIRFKDPTYESSALIVGTWTYSRLLPSGETETGTMRIDGYNGVFRADGSTSTGLITNFLYGENTVLVDWLRDGVEGYIEFYIVPGRISGESYTYPDSDYDGIWSAEQPQ
jgi:hypothetical protein